MALSDDEKKELQAIAHELANVGRESAAKEASKFVVTKDGLSTIQQLFGIGAILVGMAAYIFTLKADVAANREAINVLRNDFTLQTARSDKQEDRLRNLEIRMSKLEK
jgi:hypothetical protein